MTDFDTYTHEDLPGKLIIVEGIDGSGKSTQLDLLKKWVASQGYCSYFSEWNSSELVRSTTKRGKAQRLLSPLTFSLIHAADFADRLEGDILPSLRAGGVVLADRYIYTAFARDAARGMAPEYVRRLYRFAPKPTVAVYSEGRSMASHIAVLGIFVADATFRTSRLPEMGETVIGESVALSPGGKGSNQSVAAARLGAEVRFLSRVGRDAFADIAFAVWADAGVHPMVTRSERLATGAASVMVNAATGENAIVVCPGAALELSAVDIDAAAETIRSAAVFVTQLEQPVAAAMRGLAIAREAGVTTVLNPAPAAAVPERMLGLCDYVTPNETEASAMTNLSVESETEARAAARALRERGAGAVVITLGAQGALLDGPGSGQLVPAVRPGPVVETTGAGDAFNGAFAVALAEGRDPAMAVRFGCTAAGLSVTRPGTALSMPHRAEVEALLERT